MTDRKHKSGQTADKTPDSSPRSLSPPDIDSGIQHLQRTIGNQAVQNLLQTGAIDSSGRLQRAIGDGHDLTNSRFAGETTLEAAYDDETYLSTWRNNKGDPVTRIQQALVDLGYDLPEYGADGIYGGETKAAVRAFQSDNDAQKDGIVGQETMGFLDRLAGGGGEKPKPSQPEESEIDPSEEAMGDHVVDELIKLNASPVHVNTGVWYAHNYKYNWDKKRKQHDWQVPWTDDLRRGYADPAYWVRVGFMHWVLKPGVSAAEGVKSWLNGLTIAECYTALVVIQMDTVRAALGDTRFDELFSAKDAPPEKALLNIQFPMSKTPIGEFRKQTESNVSGTEGTIGARPAEKGEWYYFYNHPKYLLKHPGGAFQGENAIYMGTNDDGEQLWSGMGVFDRETGGGITEEKMLDEMSSAYNAGRSQHDYEVILKEHMLETVKIPKGTQDFKSLYEKHLEKVDPRYREDSGEFEDRVTVKKILEDPAYTINGTKRKGGFVVGAGVELDPDKVSAAKSGD